MPSITRKPWEANDDSLAVLGNALGDSLAVANGQGSASSIPGPVGADERSRILGMFSDGPSMASRSTYNTEPSGNGILGWQDSQSAQPGMLRTGGVGTDTGISDAEITAMRKQNLSRAQDLAAQSLARDGGSGDVQGWIDAAGRYHVEFGLTSVPAERNFLMEGSASARASAVASYNEMIANSDSWIGKAGGVAGRIGTNVGYDLADAGIGLYTLATNGNARAQLGNTLGYAATHPFNAMYAGYNKAEAYLARTDASQIAEDGARLLWGGVATAGTGKVATTVGVAGVDGAAATARWLAPKAAEMAENLMYRTGGLSYVVEPGRSVGGVGTIGRTFVTSDPGVGDIISAIEARAPGAVKQAEIKIFRPDGTPYTDFDIVTDTHVIPVKVGGGKGIVPQIQTSQQLTNLPVIGFDANSVVGAGQSFKPSVMKSAQQNGITIVNNVDDLMSILRPKGY
ncbi:hypothetical protein EH244_31245 [Variovorax beijingensis]|uniref:Uncharacterized protein n=1 Tax=Variovorax beijingensis TaxID=2496117 RepID=A0A3P3E4G7_9BURK|nr:hypothetical protein [Variovorax beijingensis]RRH79948.1 hypothetical protein EH244_31245 [Variovorax beijingensis]